MLLSILSLFYAPISTDYHYTNYTFYKLITSQITKPPFFSSSIAFYLLINDPYSKIGIHHLPAVLFKKAVNFGLWANLFVFCMIHKLNLQFGLLIHCEGISMIAQCGMRISLLGSRNLRLNPHHPCLEYLLASWLRKNIDNISDKNIL